MTCFVRLGIAGAALSAMASAVPAFAQDRFANVTIEAEDLGNGLYMMQGAGGNLMLSIGPDGAFMVDDQFAPLTDKIEARVQALVAETDYEISGVRFIVNTHYHGDHTGGNEAWAGKGATVFAHDNVRARMMEPPVSTFSGRPGDVTAPGAWPTVTFDSEVTFHMNGETVTVFHVPNAHTDGDSFVWFEEANTLHMGDVFFNGFYPYIDTNAGGSVMGFLAAQKSVLELGDEDLIIVPGHGPRATKEDLRTMIGILEDVAAKVQARIDAGDTLEQAIAAKPLAEYDEAYGSFFITSDKMVGIVYNDLKG